MISQPTTLIRINKLGKPYVQTTDPALTRSMVANDLWLNPKEGTMKMWDGTAWQEMQFGASAIMDDCITNRLLANDISASKITVGILRSQDGSFYLDLESGEGKMSNLLLDGQVEGNIIATSSNDLTRVRLRGREGTRDITAGLIFEAREDTGDTDWTNAGQLYLTYNDHRSVCAVQRYEIGAYNSGRPSQGYNAGGADGLMWRPMSTDWLRAAYATYHGYRLAKRDATSDNFTDIPSVMYVYGQCMDGTAVKCNGSITCTYKMNDIMQLDFNLKITTAGSGSNSYGISPTLLRQYNPDIPEITPISGGNLQIFNSSGALASANVGAMMMKSDDLWQPAYLNSSIMTKINESSMAVNTTLIGTCYGKYTIED